MVYIYNKIKYFVPILFFGFLGQSCNNNNKSVDPTPTYIHVDSFIFNNPTQFGDTTHQITCVWAYYNNNPIGAFDLPATIPVITSGTGTLELDPGITIDGLNSFVGTYPFYQIDTFTFAPQPGKIITHEPHTGFYSDVVIYPISNFGAGGINVGTGTVNNGSGFSVWEDIGETEPMAIGYSDSLKPEESVSNYGVISLFSGIDDSVVDSSNLSFVIPTGSAYIELDYRCDVPFALGLQATVAGVSTTPYFLAGIYPSATWQKFYLAVADFAAQYPATSYNFYIKATLPPGQSSGKIYLDNIHLVHF